MLLRSFRSGKLSGILTAEGAEFGSETAEIAAKALNRKDREGFAKDAKINPGSG
jgi:hypothetical protein